MVPKLSLALGLFGYQIPRAVAAHKKLKGAGVGPIQGFGEWRYRSTDGHGGARPYLLVFCVLLRPLRRKRNEVASFVSRKTGSHHG